MIALPKSFNNPKELHSKPQDIGFISDSIFTCENNPRQWKCNNERRNWRNSIDPVRYFRQCLEKPNEKTPIPPAPNRQIANRVVLEKWFIPQFFRWLIIQISGIFLIYANETYLYVAETIFHAAVNRNTDKGRDFALFWAAIIFMIIGTLFS